jgi:hypothetical protein
MTRTQFTAFSPGNPGYDKAPWTIRQDHPGGKAPALGTHHET